MAPLSETRQRQILEAATACFVRRGFHQSTMQEICRQAGLSPGSVYRYYRSKEEIIAVLVETSCADFLSLIESIRNRSDFDRAFDDLVDAVLDKIRDRDLCALHIEANAEALRNPRMTDIVEKRDQIHRSALAERIRDAQKTGAVDPELDPLMSAEIFVALMKGLAMRKSINAELNTMAYAPTVKTLITRFLKMGTE
jgi:TetR/AcrR family transcriptional regulator, repressor for uid operon